MSAVDTVRDVERELGEAGVPSPRVDAELLVAQVLGCPRSQVYAPDWALTTERLAALRPLVERRVRREPLAYVLGEWGFRRLVLSVDRRVLVPRPETETLVERALALIAGDDAPLVVDVGTGSGAVALSVADEHPGARVVAVDVSEEALAVARANADRIGLGDRVTFAVSDFLESVEGPVDLVVSNPPYISEAELEATEPEIRTWEPRLAVLGLDAGVRIAEQALPILRPGGAVAIECSEHRARRVAERLRALGYVEVGMTRDLTGRDRVVEGRKA